MGLECQSFPSGFGQMLAEGSAQGGPLGFRSRGGGGVGGRGFDRANEGGENGGEPKVKWFGEGFIWVGWNPLVFKIICQTGPVGVFSARPGLG